MIKKDCVFYETGLVTPRAYGPYCRKYLAYFHKFEDDTIVPDCENCEHYAPGQESRPAVRLDVDGVLRDFDTAVFRVLQKYYMGRKMKKVEKPEIKSWDFTKYYPVEKEKLMKWIFEDHAEEVFWNAPVYPGALDFANEISDIADLIIRTHQPTPLTCRVTLDWLVHHHVPITGYFCSPEAMTKKLINTLIIDDKPQNLIDNNQGILIDRPWNREFYCEKRARSYDEALEYVKKLL